MMRAIVNVKRISPHAVMPEYKTDGAAGFDLAAITGVYIEPRGYVEVRTGLAFEVPDGMELQIRGRSGLAFKDHVISFNGTIDSDYRGEVKLLLFNMGDKPKYYPIGTRLAQGVLNCIETAKFIEVETLDNTERGTGGFGSTGRA